MVAKKTQMEGSKTSILYLKWQNVDTKKKKKCVKSHTHTLIPRATIKKKVQSATLKNTKIIQNEISGSI